MTIVFTADGNRFSGEWGRPGSNPSGHFDATRSVYPIVTGCCSSGLAKKDFSAQRTTFPCRKPSAAGRLVIHGLDGSCHFLFRLSNRMGAY
jgi:hypothetical protein